MSKDITARGLIYYYEYRRDERSSEETRSALDAALREIDKMPRTTVAEKRDHKRMVEEFTEMKSWII